MLSHNQLTFDYSKLPQRYRIGNSEDIVVVFRGDVAGMQLQGISSRALKSSNFERVLEVKRTIEEGNEHDISRLVDMHTGMCGVSPLISTTYNPELAQFFAPTRFDVLKQPKRTIYKIQICADRAIVDADNIGKSGKCGEILVLGFVYPSEIKAFKRVNDDLSSEFLVGHLLKDTYLWRSSNRLVKDSSNWVEL
ncbi:hypothetical protein HYT57_01415 [Candidatus Woesearchaeota archaeon]|nr:hypothetical protein [Candidatus Woesearchaeota archaeon]MBI4009684.1 hypothetical protein [Candidatus Aenigmarchaeota archaeon]